MILQDLQKYLEINDPQLSVEAQKFELFRGLPFFNWNNLNDTRTFNHVIGLPLKEGNRLPLFDYEQRIFDILNQQRHIWILKATGLGVTEFMLRYMVWLCVRDNT
ncbi:MAG: hypothetical protein ACRD8Z_03860, partial [Nitrososphaeraceae archaeon]